MVRSRPQAGVSNHGHKLGAGARAAILRDARKNALLSDEAECAAPPYPWRSLRARITSMKPSVTALEPISGQSVSTAP